MWSLDCRQLNGKSMMVLVVWVVVVDGVGRLEEFLGDTAFGVCCMSGRYLGSQVDGLP